MLSRFLHAEGERFSLECIYLDTSISNICIFKPFISTSGMKDVLLHKGPLVQLADKRGSTPSPGYLLHQDWPPESGQADPGAPPSCASLNLPSPPLLTAQPPPLPPRGHGPSALLLPLKQPRSPKPVAASFSCPGPSSQVTEGTVSRRTCRGFHSYSSRFRNRTQAIGMVQETDISFLWVLR